MTHNIYLIKNKHFTHNNLILNYSFTYAFIRNKKSSSRDNTSPTNVMDTPDNTFEPIGQLGQVVEVTQKRKSPP